MNRYLIFSFSVLRHKFRSLRPWFLIFWYFVGDQRRIWAAFSWLKVWSLGRITFRVAPCELLMSENSLRLKEKELASFESWLGRLVLKWGFLMCLTKSVIRNWRPWPVSAVPNLLTARLLVPPDPKGKHPPSEASRAPFISEWNTKSIECEFPSFRLWCLLTYFAFSPPSPPYGTILRPEA